MRSPYPGLRPYREAESDIFYGQDAPLQTLLERLNAQRFLAILGLSGCGKSSLLHAGLLANIRPRVIDGGLTPRWLIVSIRPGQDPVGNLTAGLEALFPHLPVREELLADSHGLVRLAARAELVAKQRILIVVDQFEEVFRYRRSAPSASREDNSAYFIKLLLEAIADRSGRIFTILTMRSEFLGDCATFYGLAEQLNQGAFLLPKMTRDQTEEVITGPLDDLNVKIGQDLVQLLLNETEEQEDGLPLLQHALRRTWEQWLRRNQPETPISIEDFKTFSTPLPAGVRGVKHHLNDHLDCIYRSLSAADQLLAQRMFRLLSERDAVSRIVRRPLPFEELSPLGEAAISAVIDAFRDESRGRTFLMPPAGEALAGAVVDISHECLLRRWDRLAAWIQDEDRDAELFVRLATEADRAAAQLRASGHREPLAGATLDTYLQWRDTSEPAGEWARRYQGPPDADLGRRRYEFAAAMEYLDWSRDQRTQAEQQVTNMQVEIERGRRLETEGHLRIAELEAKRRRVALRANLFALGIVALAGVWAFKEWNVMRRQNERAQKPYEEAVQELKTVQQAASAELDRLKALPPDTHASTERTREMLEGIVSRSKQATVQSQQGVNILQGKSVSVQPNAPALEGWVYLGVLNPSRDAWVQSSASGTFEIVPRLTPHTRIPDALVGRDVHPRTWVNLRQSSASETRRDGAVINVLVPGSTFVVREVDGRARLSGDRNAACWVRVSVKPESKEKAP